MNKLQYNSRSYLYICIHHICSNMMRSYCTQKQVRRVHSNSSTLPNKRANCPFHSIPIFLDEYLVHLYKPLFFRLKVPWNILHYTTALNITIHQEWEIRSKSGQPPLKTSKPALPIYSNRKRKPRQLCQSKRQRTDHIATAIQETVATFQTLKKISKCMKAVLEFEKYLIRKRKKQN